MSNSDLIEKLMIVRDEKGDIKEWKLPDGIDAENMRHWVEKFSTYMMKKAAQDRKRLERFEGRTFKEIWDIPYRYMPISSNTARDLDFDLGVKICELIRDEGRRTMNELTREFGGCDEHLITLVVNGMRLRHHYLKDHVESDGAETFELLEVSERAKLMGLPEPKEEPKELKLSPALTIIKPPKKGADESGGVKV